MGVKLKSHLNPKIDYEDSDLAESRFESQLAVVKSHPGDLFLAYSQEPLSRTSRKSLAPLFEQPPEESSDEHPDLERTVTISTVCRLRYFLPEVGKGHFVERVGKFYNVTSYLSLPEREPELIAGEIWPDVMNQIALRLERIYEELSKDGRKIFLSLKKDKKDIVTQEMISTMRVEELPDRITLLSDALEEEYAPSPDNAP